MLQDQTEDSSNEEKPLNFIAGIIDRTRMAGFERMLWRVSKGNLYFHQTEVEDPFRNIKNVSLPAESFKISSSY